MKLSEGKVWPKHGFVLYISPSDSALATELTENTTVTKLGEVRVEVLNFLLFLVLLDTIS